MSISANNDADNLQRTANLPSNINFTMCGWFKMNELRSGQYQWFANLENGTDQATAWTIFGWSTDNLLKIHWTGTVQGMIFTRQPQIGEWFFWAMSCSGIDSGKFNGYVSRISDTDLETVSNTAGNPSFTTQNMEFFSDSYAGENAIGSMAHVRVWDAILTADEILAEKNSPIPVRTSNLNVAYRLSTSSDTNDISGNGRNPTVGGSFENDVSPTLSPPYYDDFNRPDTDDIASYWTNMAKGRFSISANRVYPNFTNLVYPWVDGYDGAAYISGTFKPTQYSYAQWNGKIASTSAAYIGVSVRTSQSGGYSFYAGETTWYLQSLSSDGTVVAGKSGSVSAWTNQDYMGISAEGTGITAWVAGVVVDSFTDSNNLFPTGAPGIAGWGTSRNAYIDNWSGGNSDFSVLKQDSFNRPDVEDIQGYTNWINYFGGRFSISSSSANSKFTAATEGFACISGSFSANQYSQIEWNANNNQTPGVNWIGVCVRGGPSGAYIYYSDNGDWYFGVCTAVGGWSGFQSGNVIGASGWTNGDIMRMEVTGTGTHVVKVYRNGTLLSTAIDTIYTALSAGAPGIAGYTGSSPASGTFANHWQGGNLPPTASAYFNTSFLSMPLLFEAGD